MDVDTNDDASMDGAYVTYGGDDRVNNHAYDDNTYTDLNNNNVDEWGFATMNSY